jgi:cytochrome oxidase Cu insertion factor (SCO1/SenC/PrrC family)
MADDPRPPKKKSKLRRVLVIAGVALGVLVLAFGGLVLFSIYHKLDTRGPGVVAGGTAADFTLPDQTGKPVALSGLVAHGPAVLVFYRGYW